MSAKIITDFSPWRTTVATGYWSHLLLQFKSMLYPKVDSSPFPDIPLENFLFPLTTLHAPFASKNPDHLEDSLQMPKETSAD